MGREVLLSIPLPFLPNASELAAGQRTVPASFFFGTRNKLASFGFCEKDVLGMGMSPREFIAFYRWCAAYCLEAAPEFEDPGSKAALFSMAQTWRALADQVERARGRDAWHPASAVG